MKEELFNVARYISVMAKQDPHLCAIMDPLHCEPNGNIIYNELTFLELDKWIFGKVCYI